jgi:hypothetical protein
VRCVYVTQWLVGHTRQQGGHHITRYAGQFTYFCKLDRAVGVLSSRQACEISCCVPVIQLSCACAQPPAGGRGLRPEPIIQKCRLKIGTIMSLATYVSKVAGLRLEHSQAQAHRGRNLWRKHGSACSSRAQERRSSVQCSLFIRLAERKLLGSWMTKLSMSAPVHHISWVHQCMLQASCVPWQILWTARQTQAASP